MTRNFSCHNFKALAVAPGWNGPLEKGMIYGPGLLPRPGFVRPRFISSNVTK